jgi:sugar phosphate isomerase/epimerase
MGRGKRLGIPWYFLLWRNKTEFLIGEGHLKNYLPLAKSYKGMFPFKLSTTSYIYPDHILQNVALIAPFFDEIELVLFESEGQDDLLDQNQMNSLIDLSSQHKIGFNIHLPIDLFLGDENEEVRNKGVSVAKKMIARTIVLNPSTFILHFDLNDKDLKEVSGVEPWRRRIVQSIEEMATCGMGQDRISIETLSYPFEWIEDIIQHYGFSICLDIGHILACKQDLQGYLEKYLTRTSIIHLHGFQNGIDHLGIDRLSEEALKLILSYLNDYNGILSIEVFSVEDLKRSLVTLEEKWGRR